MNLPGTFTEYMQKLLANEFFLFMEALKEESPVSLRLNPFKNTNTSSGQEIVPWCSTGFYLPDRPVFTLDPLFHAGGYYVQEASSMFLEQIIKQVVKSPVCCLDLCAAPGGKSTHLSALLPKGSLLVSNEIIRSRANILLENMIKWGNPSCVTTSNDPAEIGRLNHLFDMVLVDAPCSGEGMFRKDKGAINEWSPGNITLCAERQQRIVKDIWPALKPGGILIYSTCTYNLKENEDNVLFFKNYSNAEIVEIPVLSEWQIAGSKKGDIPVYRFFPHRTKGEGFFIAVIRKSSGEELIHPKIRKNKDKTIRNLIPEDMKNWINHPDNYYFEPNNTDIIAVPEKHKELIILLKENLRVLSSGIKLGEIKGKDVIPNHSLSVSTGFNKNSFPSYEVDKSTALQYLRKETLNHLPPEYEKGYISLSYLGYPLGFIKNIGNRINNLYPQEWRIRMQTNRC